MTKVYENMNELVKEFLDRAAKKDCAGYTLPESTSRRWTHDKGSKYKYHSSGYYADQSTLHFRFDNYNDVYQEYFEAHRTVTLIENAGGRSNYPQPVTLKENEGRPNYTFKSVIDSSRTTSNSVSYTNSVTVGVKVKVGTDNLSAEGSIEVNHSETDEHGESNTTGQSGEGTTTWHWNERPEVYPEGFELWWGVNRYKLQTNPDAQLVTTYTVDASENGKFQFAVNCGYKREGHIKHTTLFVTVDPSQLGYTEKDTSGNFIFHVKVPTNYNVDYYDSFPTIDKRPLGYR